MTEILGEKELVEGVGRFDLQEDNRTFERHPESNKPRNWKDYDKNVVVRCPTPVIEVERGDNAKEF